MARRRSVLALASGVWLVLAGCRPAAPPVATPATSPTPLPPAVPKVEFRWLNSAEQEAAEAFLSDSASAPARTAFLATYRQTVGAVRQAQGSNLLPALRRSWEMSRAAQAGRLSAAQIRAGVGLENAKAPPRYRHAIRMDQPMAGWRLATPATLDPDVRQVLRAVKSGEGGNYADFVARWVRAIVIVDDKTRLDPSLPQAFEGVTDTLLGTVILPAVNAITGERGPAWQVAATLVHEAEHVRWYYQVAGAEPRLLFPLPDERNSFRAMFVFLREAVLLAGRGALPGKPGVADIRADMAEWHGRVRSANGLLGYPAGDLTERHDLAVGDEMLMNEPTEGLAPPAP